MNIAAHVVKDSLGYVSVIIFEHGCMGKPLAVVDYHNFRKMVRMVEEDDIVKEKRKEEKANER